MKLTDLITQLASDVKVALPVTASTAGAGVAAFLEMIPQNLLAAAATIVGLLASSFVLYAAVKQHKMKMKIMEHELAERENRKGRRDRRDDPLDIIDN